MSPHAQGALLMAVGGVSIRLGLTDDVFAYIKPSYAPYQVIAGAVLVLLGGWTFLRQLRADAAAADGDDVAHDDAEGHGHVDADTHEHAHTPGDVHVHGHDHSGGPRVAWMLAVPLFAVLLIAPPPLGSFAANRQSGVVASTGSTFGSLPEPVDGAVELTLQQYSVRALYDPDASLEGERVRLTGFVSRPPEGGAGWYLTRFALSCCAADGQAVNVEVRGGTPPPPVDTWVTVEGTWVNREGHVLGELTADPPLLALESLRVIQPPAEPYEG